ncbi:hypothetical protein [Glutamicibacter arilaitensis]|uniref:Uncharacterized protein n=1 Tax=Glutamicibacter arilaitensis TaxID=256701 RepID=A0A4Y8TYL1_9MICC|nr:hypothetical protein [Glutamicibacter arilaitensis]TFH57276.1 hypothetical protein EXY26_09860 [Glutamicibacter arilaitensis]
MGKFVSRKGHNARITGLAMLVFGIAFALVGTYGQSDKLAGFSVFVAVAGFIMFIVGIGLGRETPNAEASPNVQPTSTHGNKAD